MNNTGESHFTNTKDEKQKFGIHLSTLSTVSIATAIITEFMECGIEDNMGNFGYQQHMIA